MVQTWLGHPSVSDEQVQNVAVLLDTDRRQTIRELGQEIGLSHTTVLHILRMRKIASRWDLTGAQRWIQHDSAHTHLDRYSRNGDAFLRRIIALDEKWDRSLEPELKYQSNE